MERDDNKMVAPVEPPATPNGGYTRREALAAMVAAGAALPLAGVMGAAEQTGPPRNLRIVTSPGGGRPVVRPEDLRFLGFLRPPLTIGDMWYARPYFTARFVGGEPRFFATGNETDGTPLYEFGLPAAEPDLNLASAPTCILRKAWGSVMQGRLRTAGAAAYPGGIHWDASTNAIWFSYGEGYVPTAHDPSIAAAVLNDSTGTYQSFGPWRTQWNSQRTRGAMTIIPPAFAATYTNGKRTGLMSTQSSGNVGSPFGAILSAVDLPNPGSTPPDSTSSTSWTIANHGLILHDLEHRQTRDTRYKTCGWKQAYDCRAGGFISPGLNLFSGSDPASGETDTMNSCVWIDLPDKHGLLYFGHLVTTPVGYSAPGDPDGFVHLWYGDPYRSDGTKPQTCCHGQDDPWWGATGPGTHYRVPMGWIYDPADLVVTAQGSAALWSRVPKSTFQWKTFVPQINARYMSGMFGGAVLDPSTRRLYVTLRHDTLSMPPNSRPAILVFQVS